MLDIDFVMTYPCYFLLTEKMNPESVIIRDDLCVCLFTDYDLVESFYKEKYGKHFVIRKIQVIEVKNQPGLVDFLTEKQPELAQENVLYLAIDTSPGKMVGRVLISEFIVDLV